jgi:hypothetical protein
MARIPKIIFILFFSILTGVGGYYQYRYFQLKEKVLNSFYTSLRSYNTAADMERIYFAYTNGYLGRHGIKTERYKEYFNDGKYLVDLSKKDQIEDFEIVRIFKMRQMAEYIRSTSINYYPDENYDLQSLENLIMKKNIDDDVLKRFYLSSFFDELSSDFQSAIYPYDHYEMRFFPYIFNSLTGCYKIIFARPHGYYQHLLVGDTKYSYNPDKWFFETVTIHKNEIKDNKLDIVLHSDMFGYKRRMSLDLPMDTN